MLPGDCLETQNLPNIISDLVLLDSLGVRLVVVHGARKHIEEQLQQVGISSEFHLGERITPRDHMYEVSKAVGASRIALEACFSSGLPNSPMYRSKVRVRGGNFVTAMPRGIIDGVDYQFTGKVRSIDTEGISELLAGNNIVLLSPLGYSLT